MSSQESRTALTAKDIRFLHKLEHVISYAHLHSQDESKIYAILDTLLASYADLFSSIDPGISIFSTPQDKLVGPEEMRAAPNQQPVRVIPDMTVKISRRDRDSGEWRGCELVLVIEAKRLLVDTSTGLSPWFDIKTGRARSANAFSKNLGQLMLQSWCSWTSFPTQDHLFLKLVTGPFVTVVKFPRPPLALPGSSTIPTPGHAENSGSRKRRRVEEGDEQETAIPVHELIPREFSPELVIWSHHIFADPLDSTSGLSDALLYALHCVTKDIVKGFDGGLQTEDSNIFDFSGFDNHPWKETKDTRSYFNVAVNEWYNEVEGVGHHYDFAADAEEKDQSDRQREFLANGSPDRPYYCQPKIFTPSGGEIPSPPESGTSAYTPPKKSKSRRPGSPVDPPSSPSRAPTVEALQVQTLSSMTTRYSRVKKSHPR
ncbi:hypothetical protein BJ322DRAFT_1063135 [Thelephora terrestris]|uniref:Uncharacterized protein n=1 Tax=Thelephora terrestris TaxID=56493 RepID=A0A9P6L7C2_9AGAM|nr:hypothetical protein BJ322DRAFT_1063135 [Thelephora terrestris]